MNTLQQHYRDTFERVRAQLPGADTPWPVRLRDQAMTAFLQQALPDTRSEDWKYTDLRSFKRHHFTPAAVSACSDDLDQWLFDGAPMHRLVFVDGRLDDVHYPFHPLLTGITLTSLANVLATQPDRLATVLGRTRGRERPAFDAMNSAFMQDGVYLRLAPDSVMELPVHLLFISTGQADAMQTVRNVIEAGPGSAATLIESWVALGAGTAMTNTVTDIMLDEAATLRHYKLVEEGAGTTHIGAIHAQLNRNSQLAAHSATLDGRLVRNTLQIDLDGAGAQCTLNGLTLTRDRQQVDNHTRIDHHQPHATSNAWYRGILADRSRTAFSGRIVVQPGAQQSIAQQSNRSLLLSAQSEADARPQFEIHADDVQCVHGCTVGELDADALFYLRARGLDENTARDLLIRAFAAAVLERMPLEPVRQYLERGLTRRLAMINNLHMEGLQQ